MSEIINAAGIHKTYRMGRTSIEVLKGLDLSVDRGSFLAIIGSSGSGKSTLLHILGALDRADAGTVEFNGSALDKFGARRLNQFRNKTVGFVFQFYHLLDELTVLENVTLPAMAAGGTFAWLTRRKSAKKKAKNLLERFGLGPRIAHKPYQLSGGERQRVAIARALMNEPEILLADEPTGNLDSETGNGILDALEELNRDGQTIIMVTHDEKIAHRACEIITLADGKIV
ncbi:MAG: ABC transporter ATP-binding protein [Planctomycetes bacterium]|nr:ABC transporter ATP-binding protein [Planctomycetota bacterium]